MDSAMFLRRGLIFVLQIVLLAGTKPLSLSLLWWLPDETLFGLFVFKTFWPELLKASLHISPLVVIHVLSWVHVLIWGLAPMHLFSFQDLST